MNYMEMMKRQCPTNMALVEDGIAYTYEQIVEMAEVMRRNPAIFPKQPMPGRVHLIRRKKILGQLLEFLAVSGREEIPVIVPMDMKQFTWKEQDELLQDVIKQQDGICMGVTTSGSTGTPKIYYRSYESWADFFPVQNRIFGITSQSRMLVQGSLSFTANLNFYLSLFSVGAVVVAQNAFQPKEWEEMITRYGVDTIYLIPSKLMCLPKVVHTPYPQIKHIITGSQSLGATEVTQLKTIFPQGEVILYYGASELSYITYVTDKEMTDERNLVGKPFPGVQVEVREEQIYVTTPYTVAGITCPYSLSDCGYLDAKGWLHFTGRSDDIVNYRGRKISTFRIEEKLREHPLVREAVVLLLATDDMVDEAETNLQSMVLTAFVTLRQDKKTDLSLQEYLLESLAHYELPKRIVTVAEMPRRDSGKIDRERLVQMWIQEKEA